MSPNAWSPKDERQYEEIVEDALDRGRDEDRAKEIAARTVNLRRRQEGRTEQQSTDGTGNPNERLEARTRDQLYNRAQELDISGRSSMNKDELIEAIRDRQ